jgi:hypothetical protein
MIESHIRVEEALAARRSFSQIYREGVRVEPPDMNRSPVDKQRMLKERAL